MSNTEHPYLSELDESLRLERPTLRSTRAFAISAGVGVVAIGLEAITTARNYSREHGFRKTLAKKAEKIIGQALSLVGAEPPRQDTGPMVVDSATSAGYYVDLSGFESASAQAQVHVPKPEAEALNTIQAGQIR